DSPLLNYSTYYNGRSFDFYFINYDGEITAEQSQLLQNIINSVKFSVTLDKPQDTSFNKQYNIKELGLKLKINEAFDVRLSDGANDNVYLTAVAIDGTPGFITLEVWEDGRSRQIFSFADLPEEELKTFAVDFTAASLQTNKVYDDYQIYTSPEINFVSFWYYSKKDGGELVRVQEIYTVYNGKVFRALYCGMEGGLDWAHSNMLVDMVKSFDLPVAQKAPRGSLAAQYQKGSALPVVLIIIGILVVVGVYLAVRHRRQIKAQKDSELNSAAQLIEAEVAACEAEASTAREAVKADEAIKLEAAAAAATAAALVAKHLAEVKSKPTELIEQEQVTAAVDDTTRVRKAKYCYKCGTALMEGAVFCHVCGTKIEKGED
ncbi:MAG: hypothetical protein PHO24_04000, partial [Clostridia bacterium]|nr:hypothetical protein [Clostridia bacterium]